MNPLPRMAIGSIQPGIDLQPMLGALNECLSQVGINVQNFAATPCHQSCCIAQDHCENPVRILDSWLLDEHACQELFWRSTRYADIALVSGTYPTALPADAPSRQASNLETLCHQLDLARIMVLDASRLGSCLIPPRPGIVDGILLDRVSPGDNIYSWQVMFEALWGTPVLGFLPARTRNRPGSGDHSLPGNLPRKTRQTLGHMLASNLNMQRLLQIAQRSHVNPPRRKIFAPRPSHQLQVAIALDDAFPCRCPDTLDLFEHVGARLQEFSPLHSERIPAHTDLVYISCGQVDRMAEQLSRNICLKQSLQHYAAGGGRIYAECDGLAYLCQEIHLPGHQRIPMMGLLPTSASLQPPLTYPIAEQVSFLRDCWLGDREMTLRSYWNPRWQIEHTTKIQALAVTAQETPLLLQHQQIIGNLAHLDFMAQLEYLPRLFNTIAPPCQSLSNR